MARKSDCTCPREGQFAPPEGEHFCNCPARSLSERLRCWLGKKIPIGGVTHYKGDDSQRAMTPDEQFTEIETTPPQIEVMNEARDPFYIRLQRRVAEEALRYEMMGIPPTWKHLGERLVTLAIEGAVVLRRWLIWAAPFIALGYIAFDIARG